MGLLYNLLAEASPFRARRAAIALLAALPLASCAGLSGAHQLPNMTPDEADAYGNYLGGQLAAVAQTAVESGQMTLDQLMTTSIVIEKIAMGEIAPLASSFFNPKSIGALALELTLNDIHYRMQLNGGFDEQGKLVQNASSALMMVATNLKQKHQELQAKQEH